MAKTKKQEGTRPFLGKDINGEFMSKVPKGYQGTFGIGPNGEHVLIMASRTEDIDDYKKPKNKSKVEKVGGKTILTTEDGKKIRLMNPREKAKKAAYELQTGVRYTNFGEVKTDKNGKPMKLSVKQRSWRSGYLAANTDSAKAYNAKKNKH